MKKLILMFTLLVGLISCANQNGEKAVKEICDKFVSGELSKVVIDDDVLKLNSDGKTQAVNTSIINLFDNPSIKSLIEENKDYVLTKEDKTALKDAIENSTIKTQLATSEIPSVASGMLMDEHISSMVKMENETRVLKAKTLGDLL